MNSKSFESAFSKVENFDPMTAVAKGAAFYADNLAGRTVSELKVYDTIPFNIGLKVQQNKFLPLIFEGVELPSKNSTMISTESSGQEMVIFEIYCGDKLFVDSEGMKKEGSFKITDLPDTNGNISFEIEIEVKKDGMLNVKARSIGTDETITGGLLNHQMDLRPIDKAFIRVKKHFLNFLPPPF